MRPSPLLVTTLACAAALARAAEPFELSSCSNDLRDLADYIRYNTEACANADLFRVDGVPLAATLEHLAQRLDEKQNDCH